MPELPDVAVYIDALERAHRRPPARARYASRARSCCAPPCRRSGTRSGARSHGVERLGKRIVIGARRRAVPRVASDDRRAAALAGARAKPPARNRPRVASLSTPARWRSPRPARSGARRSMWSQATRGAGGARSRAASTCSARRRRGVRRAAARGEPHAQARADRSAPVQRHRQRLLRRDPAPRPAFAGDADPRSLDATDDRRGCFEATRAMLREWIERLRREAGERLPGEGDGVPPGHGRARPLRQAVPGLRRAGAAHRLRRQRDELLRALPDRRQAARRSRALAAAARRAGRRRSTSSAEGDLPKSREGAADRAKKART